MLTNPSKSPVKSNKMTTSNISSLSFDVLKRVESKVVAPRNPKLLKTTEMPKVRMRPSTYLQEMSLDTEQKLASTHEMRLPRIIELLDMSETTHQKVTYVDIEEAMFQPFPSEIIFQNFKPFTTIEVPLLLRNNDKVPRLVKVIQKDSPYFNIISPDDVSHKVAPGMASVFRICFTPEDNNDYQHELICMTEREKFVVPVRAIGARAILDFPDEINFGVSPVKHANSKVILVRNIGNKMANFTFCVEEPFSVSVEQNSLVIGDSMQITVDFKPIKVGDYSQDLVVKYDCGDEIHVMLYGGSVDANVRLEKNTIRVDNTFISMANQRVVTIHNRSDVLAYFKFSPFATLQEELLRKEKFCIDLDTDESQEKERFFDECALDPTLRDRLSILTRTFHNRKQVIDNDPLLFRDDVFQIKPAEGEIWPNSSMDVTVVFRPTVARLYHQTAFCDITGRETRLPLKMRGEGMGPRCILSFDSLDIGDVFAGSSHCYEVILANKGDIDAIYGLVEPKRTQKGEKMFSFNPSEGIVLPNGHQAIKIIFSSSKLGKVSQQFVFTVDGSSQPLTFTITGNVIGPTFHFDVQKLKLGNVSFGFNHSKICTLRNTSLVTMNVNFRIPDDGNGEPSISSSYDMNGGSLLKTMSNFKLVSNPREFDISPAQGVIRAQSEMQVQVTLCSNTLKKYNCLLHVDVQGIGKSILTLPISANTIVPEVKVVTTLVKMGRCFINHLYTAIVNLANHSELPAKYNLIDQTREVNTAITYSSREPRGVIAPHSSVNVPVDVEILVVQECEETLSFSIFGNLEYPLRMQIYAKGEGPVIYYTPESLEYGMVEVLTEATKTIHIENESLIPAEFSISMVTKDTAFEVHPCEGTILPHRKIDLQVTAFLNDALLFHDKMIISIVKGQTISIPLEAKGFGTSIVSDPPLAPSMDLGSHFAESKFVQEFKITNRGRRAQQLNWSTEGHNPVQHRLSIKRASTVNPNDMKYKEMMKDLKLPTAPTFQIIPSRVSLKPGESCYMKLEGQSVNPKEVTETISCFSVLGKQNNKERIIKTIVHANFITPVVQMNREFIHFCIHKGADDQTPLTLQNENFKVKNISSLPLSCTMKTEYPFQLMDPDRVARSILHVRLDINQLIEVTVCFDPLFKYDFNSRCADGAVSITFLEHPHCEVLKLRGEVNFPNLSLDKSEIDFGCILNDTEVARYVDITNCSPLPLSYRWSFVVHQGEQNIVYNGEPRAVEPNLLDEKAVEERSNLHHVRIVEDDAHKRMEEKKDHEKDDEGIDMEEVDEQKYVTKSNADVMVDDVFDQDEEELKKLDANEEHSHTELEGDASKHGIIEQMTSEYENEERLRCESRTSSRHQPSHPTNQNIDEFPLLPWLEAGDYHIPNGVEEIFDILPLYGTLEPGETQRVTFTYYGHADISCTAKAVCEVQGGPKYQVGLKGSASLIEYNFDRAEVDFGKQMYDQVAVATLKLENTGKVGFDFEGLNGLGGNLADGLSPGLPVVDPMCGHVEAFKEVYINIYYYPGVPEKFYKTFELQVAHFEPTVIKLRGEGVFHRLALDLPRIVPTNEEKLMGLLKEAREIVEKENQSASLVEKCLVRANKQQNGGGKLDDMSKQQSHFEAGDNSMMEFEQAQDITTELEVQMEFERLMLREFALGSPTSSNMSIAGGKKSKKTPRLRLSEYLLDFGHIVLGNVKSHIVRATNTSYFAFSFKPDRAALFQSGFCMDLDRVKQLPGFPDHETVDFKITFDPRGGNLPIGPVSANVPINIVNGPQINIRLRGIVAVPDLKLNTEMVDFETVQCGQCKIVTVQLFNSERVPCEWLSTMAATEIKKKKQNPWAHHNSKKYRKKKTKHFEMMPDRGVLLPDARVNLQIKFMPTEEKIYTQKLVIHIAQATSRMYINVRGRGLEPQLDFHPSLLTFGPILPHGSGVENSLIVRNPCPFPIEFYNLNFDSQYLVEEKILRYMHGYDEYMNLLLPPRDAGNELPPELMEFNRTLEEERKIAGDGTITEGSSHVPFLESEEILVRPSSPAGSDVVDGEKDEIVVVQTETENEHEDEENADDIFDGENHVKNKEGVGELEITPVSKAIARHLGIDLSAEGRAARNRRGIVVVIHGPPRSGKTNAAVAMAKKYGAARLSIDSIVLDAISDGNTKAGLKARELCQIAARSMKAEEEESTLHVGLSYEAVNAHTNPGTEDKLGVNKFLAQSVISTKRASVLSKQTHSNIPSHKPHLQGSPEANQSQIGIHDASPVGAPIPRRLSVSASVAGEEGLVSSVLPEDLLVEILADRFQLNDCHQGFIIDGVDTLFSSGHQATVLALLKAINNRKFIYFVALRYCFANFYSRDKKEKEEEAKACMEDREFQHMDFDDLDEDEYDALPDHIKKRLEDERLEAKRQRIKKETEEKLEKQKLLDLEKAETEKRQLEDLKKKGKKTSKRDETATKKLSPGKSIDGDAKSRGHTARDSKIGMHPNKVSMDAMDKDSNVDPSEQAVDETQCKKLNKELKKGLKGAKGSPKQDNSGESASEDKSMWDDFDLNDEQKALLKKFTAFDLSLKDLTHLLDNWDRTTLDLKKPPTPEDMSMLMEDDPKPNKRASKKEREKEKLERERIERERQEKEKADREKQEKLRAAENNEGAVENPSGAVEGEPIKGVPLYMFQSEDVVENPLKKIKHLPTSEEVLDGLGLGVNGPPIPPPVSFSVVPFPVKRKPPSANERGGMFEFITAPPTMESAILDPDADALEAARLEKLQAVDSQQPPVCKKGKRKEGGRKNSPSARKQRRNSQEDVKSPPVTADPLAEEQKEQVKVHQYRWVVPPDGEIPLKVHFKSEGLGQFDQTLDFELTSTRRKYQVFCRGVSGFPTISRDPRVVFPRRRKAKLKQDEIVFKKFLMHENYFEFGPLLCGKTRERYKEKRYCENVETISIKNVSPLQSVVSFCFQHDINATTFILDPPNMLLEPDEAQSLNVWAYPKTAGRFTDSIVCCVRENPEPITYDVACHGVRPEIELDRKLVMFDKILLHRKDTKTLILRNITLLPVAWRVAGMENLGEDFTLNQESGVIATHGEFALQINFRATKPVTVKKIIRVEVYDVDNIMGLVQAENIQVTAEAYDVALDMSFPKGADGGLDFGTIRVLDESKQICSLKNKGKYEIGFNFVFEKTGPKEFRVEDLFSVLPQKGTLVGNDRPTQVQVVFRCEVETCIKELPLLKCQVIEPNLGEGKEVIASIPIKLSGRSVFSKYEVYPASDINFGPMLLNSRKSRNFTVVNKGEFDFKYSIMKLSKDRTKNISKEREGSSSSRSQIQNAKGKQTAARQETLGGQARLQLGNFNISPGIGNILPGTSQVITVDCIAEVIGKSEEFLAIDVSDRDPMDDANGVIYKIMNEGCLPGINTTDILSVFEEHRIVPNISNVTPIVAEVFDKSGVYSEEENKFSFTNIIVGRKATARFKVSNVNKVPVDITTILKPITSKSKVQDNFEVEPVKAQILAHDHVYINVTFTPTAMEKYSCFFETAVDGLPSSISRGRMISFEMSGEGSIPRVIVAQPKILNKKRNPILAFKRTLLGKYDHMQLALKNEGIFDCQVNLILEEEDSFVVDGEVQRKMTTFKDNRIFGLAPSTGCKPAYPNLQPHATGKPPYTASVRVEANSTCYFDVKFLPSDIGVYNGGIRILTVDNQFEEHSIQLYGEGFQSDVTVENLHPVNEIATYASKQTVVDMEVFRRELTSSAEAGGSGCRGELLDFGDCYVNRSTVRSFTLVNNSKSDIYRFAWDKSEKFSFKPTLGHLHPGCSKEVVATSFLEKPEQIVRHMMKCELQKISFSNPNEVMDWDDRLQIIRWINVSKEERKMQGGGPAKKKVMETEEEPLHCLSEQPSSSIELFVSARANYATFTCDSNSISFRDTLIMQPRIYQFSMKNTGDVVLNYSWQIVPENIKGISPAPGEISRTNSAITARTQSARSYCQKVATSMQAPDVDKPFAVSPMAGEIPPGVRESFTVRFAPVEVNEFQSWLLCEIHNANPATVQEPSIVLRGKSIMPHCHFDFEDSDYISRHNPGEDSSSTPLESRTRCFELSSVGMKKKQKHFWIMNPTTEDYFFKWVCDDHAAGEDFRPSFVCDNTSGHLVSGKKLLVVFTYSPQDLGTVESKWKFMILDKEISIPFLLVGHCREPQISFNLSHLKFKPTLVGRKTHETVYLINRESVDFHYTVKRSSCHANASSTKLEISPMEGEIQANTQCPILLSYNPKVSGNASFSLEVVIAHKFKHVAMNVKAASYEMDVQLLCENSQEMKVDLSSLGLNAINLGEVQLMDSCIRKLHIRNVGNYSCKYSWKLVQGKNEIPQTVTELPEMNSADESVAVAKHVLAVAPGYGFVPAGETKEVMMTFQPKKEGKLSHSRLIMEIAEGPTFACQINGRGISPGLDISFTYHNFGPCFVYKAGMPINQVMLKMVNRGYTEISVECLYKNNEFLEVKIPPLLLLPNEGTNVPIRFYPRDCIKYCEKIHFRLNGVLTRTVEIRGEGTEMKVEVLHSKQKVVKFGAIRIGKYIRHVVPIINRSPRSISLNLSVTPLSPELLEEGVMRLRPQGKIELAGNGGKHDVEVYFNPKTRIAPFTEEVMMECAGLSQPLFIVTGSCQGTDIRLDQDHIPFGAIVIRSRTKRRFTMKNIGDIGASFIWDAHRFEPDFTITPVKGYISPGMEIPFEVDFHPAMLSQDIRYEGIKCNVENHPESLSLTLTGMCINAPSLKEIMNFNCVVRGKDNRNILMNNRSNRQWVLRPVIEGDFFTGADTFTVESGQNKTYDIEYRPLLMTNDTKHQGSVFFPLPDGTGLLYNLVGTADAPKSTGSINRDVPCKTSYVELLNVENWLNKPQRFKVTVEMIKPDKLDAGTTLKGMDYIDVPAGARRDYKLKFFAHKEGTFGAKVIFKNEKTSEYMYYYITLRATSPGVISTIELHTAVRRGVSHTITVDNPLPGGVTFYSDCKISDINLPPQIVIPAYSRGSYTFEYQPLKVGDHVGKLMLLSQELGHYTYDLILKAHSCGQEKVSHFTAQLGQSHVITIKFINYARQKTEYSAKFSSPVFSAECKGVTAAPASSSGGTEVTIDVTYEPSQLGQSSGMMTLTSPIGGEYSFPLLGDCVQPKPQGPFTVKKGGFVLIPFKNVFSCVLQYQYRVDNSLFQVKTHETIRPKKTVNIQVSFDGKMRAGSVHTCMLTVVPAKSTSCNPPTWVFYLKGYGPDSCKE